MCLAIDIYKGEILNFPGVPLNNEERRKNLKAFLVDLLSKYIDYNFNVKSEFDESNSDEDNSSTNIMELNEEKITECINISIEFSYIQMKNTISFTIIIYQIIFA